MLTLALWAEEGWETVWPPGWLTAGLDRYLDALTVTMSVGLIAWTAAAHIIRAQERRVNALTAVVQATTECAGLTAPVLRAVGGEREN
jgi:hypothetical protein